MDKERMKSLTDEEIVKVENNLNIVMATLDVATALALLGGFERSGDGEFPEMQRDSVPTLLYEGREALKKAMRILEPRIELKVPKKEAGQGKTGKVKNGGL